MLHCADRPAGGKGWYAGPWASDIEIAVGYSDVGVHEPHVHERMFEVYLVARGTSVASVAGVEVRLSAGDVLVVEPGEHHTFTSSSSDYFHFVVQSPFVSDDKRSTSLEG
jgi:mannose-6-phosphate isomerase-like protein (cupin superfamily)